LIHRKILNHRGQPDLFLRFSHVIAVNRTLGRGIKLLSASALPAVGYRVSRDPQQPREKGNTAPFEPAEVCQGVVKNICRDIFRFRSARDATRDEDVDAIEIALVELCETRGIALGCLDKLPVAGFLLPCLQSDLRSNVLYLG
jgi:hypothetical protein